MKMMWWSLCDSQTYNSVIISEPLGQSPHLVHKVRWASGVQTADLLSGAQFQYLWQDTKWDKGGRSVRRSGARRRARKGKPSPQRWLVFPNNIGFGFPTLSSLQLSVFLSLSLSPDSSSSVSTVRSQSRLVSALYWLCGMETKREEEDAPAPPPEPKSTACFLEEKPRLKAIVNVNLLICLTVTAFIIGYWAWQACWRDTEWTRGAAGALCDECSYWKLNPWDNFLSMKKKKTHNIKKLRHQNCCNV